MNPSLRSGLKTQKDTSTVLQFAKAHCKLGSGQKTKKDSSTVRLRSPQASLSASSSLCSEQVLQKLTAIEDLLKQSRQAGMLSANDDRAYRLADKPLTFKEACTYLGYAPSYLYKLTYQKKIPHYKPTGKVIFFSKNELNEWVFKCRCENSEISNQNESHEPANDDPNQVEMFLKEKVQSKKEVDASPDPSLRQNNGGQVRSGQEEERWIEFPLKSRRKVDSSR